MKKITKVRKKVIDNLDQDYIRVLAKIKKTIQEAQIKAAFSVNKELLKLYWWIGKTIYQKQQDQGWGSKIIETLAQDLQKAFPGISGFSRSNIFRMKAFFDAYRAQYEELLLIVAEPPRQLESKLIMAAEDMLPMFHIPWWHNVVLLTKLKDFDKRIWYAQQSLEHGWSSSVLLMHIEANNYARKGKAITNFSYTLPKPHSDMAQQALKDPYNFDFLSLQNEHKEKDIEMGLLEHIQTFLLELGEGFAFVAQQKHLEVAGDDFYIDLLFYHITLRCYIVVELKAVPFKPEHTGQLNFYLSAVDDLLKQPDDKPTIGLLLCKTKNNITAEYALRGISRPIGVAEYKIVKTLPKELKNSLPTIETLELELSSKKIKKTMSSGNRGTSKKSTTKKPSGVKRKSSKK